MNAQYKCIHCGGFHTIQLPSFADEPKLPAPYEQLVKRMWEGGVRDGDFDMATALDIASDFLHAITEGYGNTLDKAAFNSPDWDRLASLEKDVYHFSAAKDYKMLQALTHALKDGTDIRSFPQWRREAAKTLDSWVGAWQKTEYDTALADSQHCAFWARVDKYKNVLKLIKFVGVGDELECPICLPFNNMIRPWDDPVWVYVGSSLHFGDRCTRILLPDHYEITPDDKVPGPDGIPAMFRTNFAKDGYAFPPDHAYYVDQPKDIERDIVRMQVHNMRDWAKDNLIGKTAANGDLKNIQFTNAGIKEALNQPHKYQFEKNQAIYQIKNIIKDATYVKTVPDIKGRPLQWHYLETEIKGAKSWIVIKEVPELLAYIFYTIVDALK